MEIQIIISLITIIGSGVGVYVGVRVALAEIRKDIKALENKDADIARLMERDFQDLRGRVSRLEEQYFNKARS